MDNNYVTELARILRKAQCRIDAETGETIDIGGEVQRLRNICDRLRVESETLDHVIGQAQPVPEGWRVDLEPTGHIVMRSPNGGFAVINPPEHEAARLAVVSQFLATMLAAAPPQGADNDR